MLPVAVNLAPWEWLAVVQGIIGHLRRVIPYTDDPPLVIQSAPGVQSASWTAPQTVCDLVADRPVPIRDDGAGAAFDRLVRVTPI